MEQEQQLNRSHDTCNRCGYRMFGIFNEVTKLVGGYHAVLCVDCRSDWDVFIRNNEAFLSLQSIQDSLWIAHQQISFDGDNRRDLINKLREDERSQFVALYAIGESWTRDRIEREQAPPPTPLTPEEIAEHRRKQIQRYEKHLKILKAVEKTDKKK